MGYVYRDLKPSNILVTHHGILYIYSKGKLSFVILDWWFKGEQSITHYAGHLSIFVQKDLLKVKKIYQFKHR